MSGSVLMPNGSVALQVPSLLERVGGLVASQAVALTANVQPVGRNVRVRLRQVGVSTFLGETTTNDQGLYRFTLPDGVTEGACPPLVIEVGSGSAYTRALVYSTTDAVDIDFASEAAVRLIVNQVSKTDGSLCAYTPRDVRNIVDMIRQKPGFVPGTTAGEVNANATEIAGQDPAIQAAVAAPIAPFTPTPTGGAISTPTRTPTTGTPTATFTTMPTNTPAPTTAVPTTAVPTNTPQPTTAVPTTAPPTTTPTLTPTTAPIPALSIGSTNAAAGAAATVTISLTTNGFAAVTIAPMLFDFDNTRLTFTSCTSKVGGKTADASLQSPGRVSLVLSGGLSTIPDGAIVDCTFAVGASASGNAALTYVSAGVSNGQQPNPVEVLATGSSGSISITGGSGPQIGIGTATGVPGSQVIVPLSFTQNGAGTVTIAPLLFDFDAARLTFGTCVSKAAGKTAEAAVQSPGRLSVVLSGDVQPFADGTVAECGFGIQQSAATGTTPLTFQGAGLSNASFVERLASGSNGAVTVNATTGPVLLLGAASGTPGAQVTVPIELRNGVSPATIAPLVFDFDATKLSFVSCASTASGKTADAKLQVAGRVSLVLSGDLTAIPNGGVATCTFGIAAGATRGMVPLTFVTAAVSDASFNETIAAGGNGAVTVR